MQGVIVYEIAVSTHTRFERIRMIQIDYHQLQSDSDKKIYTNRTDRTNTNERWYIQYLSHIRDFKKRLSTVSSHMYER
jgi:hypothetical protein